jgi:hypothetical protein
MGYYKPEFDEKIEEAPVKNAIWTFKRKDEKE